MPGSVQKARCPSAESAPCTLALRILPGKLGGILGELVPPEQDSAKPSPFGSTQTKTGAEAPLEMYSSCLQLVPSATHCAGCVGAPLSSKLSKATKIASPPSAETPCSSVLTASPGLSGARFGQGALVNAA